MGSVGLKAQRRRVVDEGSDDEMPEPEAKRKKDAAVAKRGSYRMTDSSSPGASNMWNGWPAKLNCQRIQSLLLASLLSICFSRKRRDGCRDAGSQP